MGVYVWDVCCHDNMSVALVTLGFDRKYSWDLWTTMSKLLGRTFDCYTIDSFHYNGIN